MLISMFKDYNVCLKVELIVFNEWIVMFYKFVN